MNEMENRKHQLEKSVVISTGRTGLRASSNGMDKTNELLERSYLVWSPLDNHHFHRVISQLDFQHGPIKENGVNGITEKMLLDIVVHRLRGHQLGDYASIANDNAIALISHAISELQERTKDREDRGVEGTSNA